MTLKPERRADRQLADVRQPDGESAGMRQKTPCLEEGNTSKSHSDVRANFARRHTDSPAEK